MIRFIDLGNQISDDPDDKFFGFFDSTTGKFIVNEVALQF